MTETVFIALGANLGEPRAALSEALARLRQPDLHPRRRARLYRSTPVGPQDQPRFWNTMVEATTSLTPEGLLDRLKAIEETMGRTPTERWGPRVIDLDIILFSDARIRTERLIVPHVEMANRRFVLAPLADLAPGRLVPGHDRTVSELLADVPNEGEGAVEVADHSILDLG